MAEGLEESGKMPDEVKRKRRGPITFVKDTVKGAFRLAGEGLLVAVAMGVFFGLTLGFGGQALNMESSELIKLAGMSGWVSGLVAMLYVFRKAWRRGRGH